MVFEGIPEFIAVAEAEGFTAAAKRLSVSTAHVSRRVAALESRLGTALLVRTTRSVRLTDSGQAYYRRCRELVAGLEEANELASSEQVQLTGTLRVSMAGEFTEQFIAPALIAFAAEHDALSLDLDFNSRLIDFSQDNIDFSIRYGRLSDSGLVARKLAQRSLVAVASPAYLERFGEPQHPQQLRQHACLVANNTHWFFDGETGPMDVRVKPRLRTNSSRNLVLACQQGLGICYMPRSSVGAALNDGSLVSILTPFNSREITTWIVYANRQYLPSKARLAINYLLDHFKDWQE